MRLLFLVGIVLNSMVVFAQDLHCGADEMHHKLYMGFPEIHDKVIQNHQELEAFTANFDATESKAAVLFTIPVVFHVIHNYGAENISDEQIYDQVAILNEDFQKLNADTGSIASAFQAIAADCQIEFKLAKLDPSGQCTNGITRNASSETYIGDHAVKSIVHWDPSMYLNIYICADAAGLAGHALVPPAADTVPNLDGIVLRHDYCGSIGTSSAFRSTVLTHEIGHYLNLQHTWGGNNVPGYPYLPVADAGNCAFDDGVADTPLTIGWQTCNLSGNTCSSLDNVQNYMEYAYCAIMFTEGQKTRMHAALNSSIANRDNLWSPANLVATGVNDPDYLCKVDFVPNKTIVCVGDTVWLSDLSYHLITSREWTLSGATAPTQTDSLAYAVYSSPGNYSVKLSVTDGSISDSLEANDLITVLPTVGSAYNIQEGFEAALTIPNSDWTVLNTDGEAWKLNTGIGYEGSNSVWIDNLGASDGRKDELISFPIDVSHYTDIELDFRYAYAKTTSLSHGKLSVYISKDCGATWILRKVITAFDLNTATDTLTVAFVPANQSEWKQESVTNILSSYLVDNLQIKFLFESGEGNNIYLDNINLFDPNTVSVNQIKDSEISIYPNPTNDHFRIRCDDGCEANKLELFDRSGRLVMETRDVNRLINIHNLEAGWYNVKVYKEDGGIVNLPLILF